MIAAPLAASVAATSVVAACADAHMVYAAEAAPLVAAVPVAVPSAAAVPVAAASVAAASLGSCTLSNGNIATDSFFVIMYLIQFFSASITVTDITDTNILYVCNSNDVTNILFSKNIHIL